MSFHHGLITSMLLATCASGTPLFAQCGDYDDDGFDDLPAGTPQEQIGGYFNAGCVNVIYGTGNGLKSNGDQFFTLDEPGVAGDLNSSAYFGSSLASGDFDGDGFDDLATGSVYHTIDGLANAGSVNVLYGSNNGLRTVGDQHWHRNVAGVKGVAQQSAYFGWFLVAGDFDDDGFDDLAIGVRGDDIDGADRAGSVHILYGSTQGLTASGDQIFHQNSAGVNDVAEANDAFGWFLALGDFDDDGRDDLAIGIPRENVDGVAVAGATAVLFGGPGGLSAAGDQFWSQNSPGIIDVAEAGDEFGWTLAAGDFDDDGFDDLAIGVPEEVINGVNDAGAVHVLYGAGSGLRAIGDDFWHQDVPGILDAAATGEDFGWWLASGDFDDDGFDDLAIGIPFSTAGGDAAAGAFAVLYGRSSGLGAVGDQYFTRATPGVAQDTAPGDNFGFALYVGDFDGDGHDDLGVVAPEQIVDGVDDAGSIHVFYGANSGLAVIGDQVWTQNSSGIGDSAEENDRFGKYGGDI